MRRDDWLLAQLPVGMLEDDFFVRFVSIFQQVATTMLEDADNIEYVLDPTGAPDDPSWVSIRVAGTGGLTERDFLALVRDQVPAHAYTEVHVGDRRIWPPVPTTSRASLPELETTT